MVKDGAQAKELTADPPSAMYQYLLYDLAAAHRSLHAGLNDRLKQLGLQVESWRVLETLRHGQRHTMGQIADIVLMNPPTLTKLVDRMVANGLVQRVLADDDHRKVQLVLTDAGMELMSQVGEFALEQDREITDRLGEENTRALREALRSLA